MNITRLNTSYGDDVVRVGTSGGGASAAELAVKTTYNNLVALRDSGRLVAGQMYRITDYETTCTWENTQCAGHPFDIITVALDNKTLDEKCSAIWSERDTEGYFANNDLPAWDVRYCLDNDTNRFDWAQQGGYTLKISAFDTEFNTIPYGNFIIGGVNYYMWAALYEGNLAFAVLSENPKPPVQDTVYLSNTGETINGAATVIGAVEQKAGNGVIYRLVDESGNSVPYDFKNIMFSRPLVEGRLDVENGVDTFCYTFCCIDDDTFEIADQSVKEPFYCTSNRMGSYSKNNIFLTFSRSECKCNTFGEECFNNTFGSYCNDNTLGNGCTRNTFGEECFNNTFGLYCFNNTFREYCNDNTLGNGCYNNTFGNACYKNTFGDDCYRNALGNGCYNNTFGNGCHNCGFTDRGSFNPLENAIAGCHHNNFAEFTERLCLWREPASYNPKEICYIKVESSTTMGDPAMQGVAVSTLSNAPQIVVRIKNGYIKAIYYDDIINA